MEPIVKYSIIDLILYFIVLLLGIKGRGKSTTVLDYFFGGRKLSFTLLAITFGCSWMIQANVWQRISASRNIMDAKKMTTLSFFLQEEQHWF